MDLSDARTALRTLLRRADAAKAWLPESGLPEEAQTQILENPGRGRGVEASPARAERMPHEAAPESESTMHHLKFGGPAPTYTTPATDANKKRTR